MIKLSRFSSFFVANWKLNGNFKFIDQFIDNLQLPKDDSKCVVICPTSIHLDYLNRKKNNFYVGSQNISNYKEGAYTGEISSDSLYELKINFCIVGHSERRHIFNENDSDINSKSMHLINNDVVPIICLGETLEDRKKGNTNNVLSQQIEKSIPKSSNSNNTIIAYEPVWAIGTGLTPSLEEINITHEFIRNYDKKFNDFKILYGGSVNASNSKEILTLSNVNGALIGGASLKYEEFTKIIQD